MMRWTIALLACIAVCWISTPSQSAEISGAWRIATQGGPTPICSFIQVGNNLSGACIGPQATGTITGTVFGSAVRWRWQWVTYGGNSAAAFDFLGTLTPGNTMTGMLERRETGLSLKFAAKRIIPVPSTPSASISVPLQTQGGTYVVPILINNAITLDFTVDSGATDVSVPADVVMTLIRARTLNKSDFIGSATYVLADGSTMPSTNFRIRSLKVGDKIVEDVTGSVAPVQGTLLLGQSFLNRFKSWSVDNTRQTLILVE